MQEIRLHRRKYNISDLKKCGHLTILEEKRRKKGHRRIQCKCDCGKIIEINLHSITHNKQQSCGCELYCKLYHREGKEKNPSWTGYGEIPGSLFGQIRRNAKNTKREFSITIQDMWELFLKQNKCCALSGIPLQFQSEARLRDGTASLDRIDSSKDYIKGNLQWVHKNINKMKSDFEQNNFIKLCKAVAQYQKL